MEGVARKSPEDESALDGYGIRAAVSVGCPYGEYFSSPELIFPVVTRYKRLSQKTKSSDDNSNQTVL